MATPLISVQQIAKAYRIGLKDDIPDTFMGAMTGWAKAPLKNWKRLRSLNTFHKDLDSLPGASSTEATTASSPNDEAAEAALSTNIASDIVWALRDLTFDVNEGEVVGIIGHNGAGKSTLLKVLSRITDPTRGRAVIHGRVSSLLEVGTGFHPELTGRENVYMNGTILGMSKREIDSKFDEIVHFSGVEKFLDTPVKRYSSGMKVRLAFAVAAHLEPEILIIDEVLAVGDAGFQQKCIGKMQDVAHSGRTVLFVSHNAVALRALCHRGILLEGGRSVMDGPLAEVLNSYLADLNVTSKTECLETRKDRGGKGDYRFASLEVLGADLRPVSSGVATGDPAAFRIKISRPVNSPHVALRVFDSRGHFVIDCDSRLHSPEDSLPNIVTDSLQCDLPEMLLMQGKYRIDAELWAMGERQDQVKAAVSFEVINGRLRGRPVKERGNRPQVAHPQRWQYSASSIVDTV